MSRLMAASGGANRMPGMRRPSGVQAQMIRIGGDQAPPFRPREGKEFSIGSAELPRFCRG
jgi:hypothetical protein